MTVILPLLILSAFIRLDHDKVLDNFHRVRICNFILKNPGIHYNALKNKLAINNGTANHHLRVLESKGFIKSKREGKNLRFYTTDCCSDMLGNL